MLRALAGVAYVCLLLGLIGTALGLLVSLALYCLAIGILLAALIFYLKHSGS